MKLILAFCSIFVINQVILAEDIKRAKSAQFGIPIVGPILQQKPRPSSPVSALLPITGAIPVIKEIPINDVLNAVKKGNTNDVTKLIKKGANINSKNADGVSPLILAAESGNDLVLDLLLLNGADINITDKKGRTALHTGALNGHEQIVNSLLGKGATINSMDNFGFGALHLASTGHVQIVEVLIKMGANLNLESKERFTPLSIAVSTANEKVAEILINGGSDVNIQNDMGWTALFIAASTGLFRTVELLIGSKANANLRAKNGMSPIDIAVSKGYYEIVDILKKYIAEGNEATVQTTTFTPISTSTPTRTTIKSTTTTTAATKTTSKTTIKPSTTTVSSGQMGPPDIRPALKACDRYAIQPISHIVGGDLATSDEFPWMAALVYVDTYNYSVSFDCGGTIISEFFVLSAAHCMRLRPPSVVRLGKLSLIDEMDNRAVNYHIQDIIRHPNWSFLRKKNDIALVRVSRRISFTDFIIPACLDTRKTDLPSGTKLTVTGWGSTSAEQYHQSAELRKTQLLSMSLPDCNATLLKYNEKANLPAFASGVSESQYCAHDPKGKMDSCQGDSGGPLQYFPITTSLAHVVGIVSFGISCGTELPGIYTRVGYYIDWIEPVVWPMVAGIL